MSAPIQDEFTHLPISRQRKYQMRLNRDGRCICCGAPQVVSHHCLKHAVYQRERMRRIGHHQRKNNSLTRRIERKQRRHVEV